MSLISLEKIEQLREEYTEKYGERVGNAYRDFLILSKKEFNSKYPSSPARKRTVYSFSIARMHMIKHLGYSIDCVVKRGKYVVKNHNKKQKTEVTSLFLAATLILEELGIDFDVDELTARRFSSLINQEIKRRNTVDFIRSNY